MEEYVIEFLNLGMHPLSNANLIDVQPQSKKLERRYPLRILFCPSCWLVQTKDYLSADEIFTGDYPYYSSVSSTWIAHSKKFSEEITKKLALNRESFVVEVASNDGYLLRYFVEQAIPCLGIEPTSGPSAASEKAGVPVLQEFFGLEIANRLVDSGKRADLIIANNVLAHVPNINDFVAGLKRLLKPSGVITIEFPHLMNLIDNFQFDTFYHEHFSYLSLIFLQNMLKRHSLTVFDVEEIDTHGGSLRVYVSHVEARHESSCAVKSVCAREIEKNLDKIDTYKKYALDVDKKRIEILEFLNTQKLLGKKIAGYGAAAKANTLFNYLGINSYLVTCVYDAAPSKQGKFMPGSHIEIFPPAKIYEDKPDFIWILPWNLIGELKKELEFIQSWNGKLFMTNPQVQIL